MVLLQAYCGWMKATLQFELEQWKSAIELFTNAKYVFVYVCLRMCLRACVRVCSMVSAYVHDLFITLLCFM